MDLNKLEALAQAATPGPWDICVGSAAIELRGGQVGHLTHPRVCRVLRSDCNFEENSSYVSALSPDKMCELIALIRSQAAEIDGLKVRADMLAAELLAAQQAKPAGQAKCEGCNGYGMVGNILDTDTCPFCKGTGEAEQVGALSDEQIIALFRLTEPSLESENWTISFARALLAASQPVAPVQVPTDVRAVLDQAPQQDALDTSRLDFIASEKCIVDCMECNDTDGLKRYWLSWPYTYTEQEGTYLTPREAIDAARAIAALTRSAT